MVSASDTKNKGENMSRGRALVIAPHADDETFGCGGTIVNLKHLDIDTTVVVICKPDEQRKEEFYKATRILRVFNSGMLFENVDGKLDTIPQKELVTNIEMCLDYEFADGRGYDYVFIPYPSHHQDHKAVYNAAIAAMRPGAREYQPRAILAYEYAYPHWSEFKHEGKLFVDISGTKLLKVMAMEAYVSQQHKHPHPISSQSYLALASTRGLAIGCEYAEMFYIIQMRGLPTWQWS